VDGKLNVTRGDQVLADFGHHAPLRNRTRAETRDQGDYHRKRDQQQNRAEQITHSFGPATE
jgi:hypothetical protein